MNFRFLCVLMLASTMALGQEWFRTGQDADLMLSGVGFNNTGGPLLFNHPTGIASEGTHFLLCDRFNNRVLVWKDLPTQWDALPDLVLGQDNFTSNNPGTSKGELNWPGNVSVSSSGLVAVADTENDRILIWKSFPTRNAQAADLALALPGFTAQGASVRYGWPWGVWTDGTRLAAVATHGGALLFWNTMPTRDDQPPDYIVTHAQLGTPRNISTDGATYFFVGDHNAKVESGRPATFFWNAFPTQANQPFDFFREEWIKGVKLPQGQLAAGGLSTVYFWNTMPTAAPQNPALNLRHEAYKNGDGPDVVYAGGRLYINNYNGNNVQVYNTIPASPAQPPDFVLGSPDVNANTLNELNYIQNPVVATDGTVLVVTSDFDAAIWIWKTLPHSSGLAPDLKISVRGFNLAPWDNALHGGRLVLAGKQSVAVWTTLPLNGERPSYILANKIGSVTFQNLRGVALDENFFYLADENGTLAIWSGLPSTGNEEPLAKITGLGIPLNHLHSDGTYLTAIAQQSAPSVYVYRVADIVAGSSPQPFKTITRSEQLPLNLSAGAITFNGSLAIANTNGNAVYLWKNLAEAGDPNKVVVLGQTAPANIKPAIGINRLFMPASLAAHGNNLWVGEIKFSSRLLRFSSNNVTAVDSHNENLDTPHAFALEQNYPNPFNPSTTLRFVLPRAGHATLKVFDVLGKEVATLLDEPRPAGIQTVSFDARALPSGVYFYQLQMAGLRQRRKMLLAK